MKLFLAFVTVFTLMFANTSFAASSTPAAKHQHALRFAQVSDFLQWLNSMGHFEKMSGVEIEKHFAKDFVYSTNGKVTAKDATSLQQLFLQASSKYKMAYIHFPLKSIRIEKDKVFLNYQVTFVTLNNEKIDDMNTVVIQFNSLGKVVSFTQQYASGIAPLTR